MRVKEDYFKGKYEFRMKERVLRAVSERNQQSTKMLGEELAS